VVYERLGLARVFGNAKDLCEKLLDDTEMSLLLKCSVEGQDWSRSLEAVADEVEFLHGVQVLQVHLDGGSVGWFAHPAVQILAFARLEEENVVAVVEFCRVLGLQCME
jgi:hypothetical protein